MTKVKDITNTYEEARVIAEDIYTDNLRANRTGDKWGGRGGGGASTGKGNGGDGRKSSLCNQCNKPKQFARDCFLKEKLLCQDYNTKTHLNKNWGYSPGFTIPDNNYTTPATPPAAPRGNFQAEGYRGNSFRGGFGREDSARPTAATAEGTCFPPAPNVADAKQWDDQTTEAWRKFEDAKENLVKIKYTTLLHYYQIKSKMLYVICPYFFINTPVW